MAIDWCPIVVIIVIVLFAITTYWSYSVPKEYKERHARWKRILK